MFKTHVRGRLLITVCAASFAYAGALSAQTMLPSYDFSVDQYLDPYGDLFLNSNNWSSVESSAGADLSNLSQTAVSSADSASVALNLDLIGSISIDQSFNSDMSDIGLFAGAANEGAAWTTIGDSFVSGSQIAVSSLSTATVDVSNYGGDAAMVGVNQTIDGIGLDTLLGIGGEAYDFVLGAGNSLAAVTAFGGNATIDGLVDNPDYIANVADRPVDYDVNTPEFISSVQQAAVSLNTLRVTGDVNTDVSLNDGQGFDVLGVSGREWDLVVGTDAATNFLLSATNEAVAYSPRGYSLVTSDPSVSNLDQVASLTANGVTLGAADGTADFSVSTYSITNFDLSADPSTQYTSINNNIDSQSAYFNGGDLQIGNETELGNTAVATTYLSDYEAVVGNTDQALTDYYNQPRFPADVGNVGVSDLSQVAALSVNGINNLGTGSLTLKGYEYLDTNPSGNAEDYIVVDSDFTQYVSNYNYDSNAQPDQTNIGPTGSEYINTVGAFTGTGDADLSSLSQTTQFSFNSISSGGDLNGWVSGDTGPFGSTVDSGVEQYVDGLSFNLEGVNEAWASVEGNGDVTASDLSQVASLQVNRASAAGDIRADIYQDTAVDGTSVGLTTNDAINYVGLEASWDGGRGDVTGENISQIASIGLNSISATGTLDADGNLISGGDLAGANLDQHSDSLAGINIFAPINLVEASADLGDISADATSQVAQISLNSIRAADDLTGLDGVDTWSVHQDLADLSLGGEGGSGNVIDLGSDSLTGDVALNDGSQIALLNANAVTVGSTLSGGVQQDLANFNVGYGNSTYLASYDGDVAVNGLTQTLSASYNSLVAEDLGAGYVDQNANDVWSMVGNYTRAQTDYGMGSVDGAVQQAINRVNNISIGQ